MKKENRPGNDFQNLMSATLLLEALAEGVYFTNTDRKILYWNKGAEAITGFSADEVVGSHCWDNILMHVDEQGRSLCRGACPLVRCIQSGEPTFTNVFLTHKMGHRLPVVIRTIPLRDLSGQIAGAMEIFAAASSGDALLHRLKELESQSLSDPLTGLSNRRGLELHLRAQFERRKRYGTSFGIIFLDIDNFNRS